jgi:hypothetical protein
LLRLRNWGPWLLAGLLSACINQAAPDYGSDPTSPDPKDPDLDPVPALPSAYFTLEALDILGTGWPDDYAGYDLFVCNPSIPAARITQARQARPDATFLGYTNVTDLHIRNFPGNPYWNAMEVAFDSTRCVVDLDTGNVVRIYGNTGEPGSGVPYFVMQQEQAEILVAFHRDVTLAAGFDGLYVDNCTAVIPNWRYEDLLEAASSIDYNGDQVADDPTGVPGLYSTWRPYYTQRLREEVGDAVLLVGNAGGALADPALNGITLEGVGDRFPVEVARSHFEAQEAVALAPFLGVAWVTTPASEGPTRGLVPEIPGLYYGVLAGF